MAEVVWKAAAASDVAVMAAAVADFRPADPVSGKLRRQAGPPEIHLEPTPDILAGIAEMADRPYLVGFAAEVGSLESDTNEVTIITADGHTESWELMTKLEIGRRLIDEIVARRTAGEDS